MDVLVAIGHVSDDLVDPGVERDHLRVEEPLEFEALGKSPFKNFHCGYGSNLLLCFHPKHVTT